MRHGHGSIPDTTPRRGAGTLAGPRAASAAGTISASAEPPDWGTNQRPAHPGQSHLITSDGRPCFPIRLISRHEAAKWCLCFMPRNLLSSSVALPSLSLLLVQRLFSLGSLWTACSFPPLYDMDPLTTFPLEVSLAILEYLELEEMLLSTRFTSRAWNAMIYSTWVPRSDDRPLRGSQQKVKWPISWYRPTPSGSNSTPCGSTFHSG